jgi:hypothetical protein
VVDGEEIWQARALHRTRDHAILCMHTFGCPKAITISQLAMLVMNRKPTMAQITLTQEEAAALRGALNSYVSDLRMEIADTDSWQFRQNLKREALLLKKLLEQLDAELASPAASL